MGGGAGADQDGAGQEERRAALGGAVKRQPQRGRGGPALGGAGPSHGLAHLLRQSRAHRVEVPREGLGRQDCPSDARPLPPLHQVLFFQLFCFNFSSSSS